MDIVYEDNRLIANRKTGRKTKDGYDIYEFKCKCGETTKNIAVKVNNGISSTPEYIVLKGIIKRCTNPKDPAYHNYGGRGIIVCDRWLDKLNGLNNFIADMGPRPSDQHSLDRKENDGNYEPNNCKWSTRLEQNNNRRSNVIVTYKDKDYTYAQLAREENVNYKYLCSLLRKGVAVETALMNARRKVALANYITVDGVTYPHTAIVVDGIVYDSVYAYKLKFNINSCTVSIRVNSSSFIKWYKLSDMYDRHCIIKGIEYKSVEEYSIQSGINNEIILSRIQSTKDIHDDYKWKE